MGKTQYQAPRTALIDGDVLVYLAGFASQKTIWTHTPSGEWFIGKTKANEWWKLRSPEKMNMDDWSSEIEVEPWSQCMFIVDGKIGECKHMTDSTDVLVFLSPSTTFRHDVAFTKEYKGNRKDAPKPVYYHQIKEYLIEEYGAIIGERVEADDLMGMAQTTDSVICSNDKDMLQIPGRHYNFTKDVEEAYSLVDPYAGDRWFFVQLLAGDSTDNIQGIPGTGVKKAEKIVDMYEGDHYGLLAAIKDEYEAHYGLLGQETMEEHAALVWILRSGDSPENAGWRDLLDVTPITIGDKDEESA